MKKLLWLIAAPVLITACKKDNDNSPAPDTVVKTCQLVEIQDSITKDLKTSYEYDASRRVSKISSFSSGQLRRYQTYTYSGNKIELRQFDGSDLEIGTGTGELNPEGFLTKFKGRRQVSNDVVTETIQDSTLITYNNAGQMLSSTGYYSKINNGIGSKLDIRTNTFEYSNGRLAKENVSVVLWNSFTLFDSLSTSYTYDNNSPLITSNPYLGSAGGISLTGKLASDKMPVKAVETRFNSATGLPGNSSTTYFSATVDPKGNPTRIRISYEENGSLVSETLLYNYNCP